jgi:hypothetical protein
MVEEGPLIMLAIAKCSALASIGVAPPVAVAVLSPWAHHPSRTRIRTLPSVARLKRSERESVSRSALIQKGGK